MGKNVLSDIKWADIRAQNTVDTVYHFTNPGSWTAIKITELSPIFQSTKEVKEKSEVAHRDPHPAVYRNVTCPIKETWIAHFIWHQNWSKLVFLSRLVSRARENPKCFPVNTGQYTTSLYSPEVVDLLRVTISSSRSIYLRNKGPPNWTGYFSSSCWLEEADPFHYAEFIFCLTTPWPS